MTEMKRKPKSDSPRTGMFSIRFDQELKYLAEIAARQHRRSLANFIEWNVINGLKETILIQETHESVWSMKSEIWDVSEADRFVKLAFNFPELLNHEEQILWKVIRENGNLWKGKRNENGSWQWKTHDLNKLIIERLRRKWDSLKNIAAGEVVQPTMIDEQDVPDRVPDIDIEIWNAGEADKFVNLAFNFPDRMTPKEQILWKVIQEKANLWKGKRDKDGNWRWTTDDPSKLSLERLHKKWEEFKRIAHQETENTDVLNA